MLQQSIVGSKQVQPRSTTTPRPLMPGSREKSVYASVELSLRRMSPENRDKVRVLRVFHGGVQLGVLRVMMEWEEADVVALARELVATGLATPDPYNHLSLNPALCPYLRLRMDQAESESLQARWAEAMRGYVEFLNQQEARGGGRCLPKIARDQRAAERCRRPGEHIGAAREPVRHRTSKLCLKLPTMARTPEGEFRRGNCRPTRR
jgi:hypothetical protein